MTTGVPAYSITPASNVQANTGINWDEGMSPGAVNNSARANMADLRTAFNDLIWFQYGSGTSPVVTPAYVSGTSFKVAGVDVTVPYHIGRRVKAVGTGTGTIYGSISAGSFSTDTTVTVVWDSGTLSNETLAIYLAQVPVTGTPVASSSIANLLTPWVAAGGTADAITATYSPALTALVDGQLCYVRASVANATTTPTFAPNGLTAHTITKAGGGALVAGDIPAALAEVVLRYNLANTRWELQNPSASNSGIWTPADGSGASLSFTSPIGYYRRSGNMVTIWGSLQYPSTANGTVMSISGLPFTSANLTTESGGFVGTGNFTGNQTAGGGGPYFFVVPKNTATLIIRDLAGTQLTNTGMTTWKINFTISYPI